MPVEHPLASTVCRVLPGWLNLDKENTDPLAEKWNANFILNILLSHSFPAQFVYILVSRPALWKRPFNKVIKFTAIPSPFFSSRRLCSPLPTVQWPTWESTAPWRRDKSSTCSSTSSGWAAASQRTILQNTFPWANCVRLCPFRWRTSRRSLFCTWCTSLEVSNNFHRLGALMLRLWCPFALSPGDPSERTRLRDDEYPLVTRVLHGPCEKISKILITEADLGEEVTYDVSASPLSTPSPPNWTSTDTQQHNGPVLAFKLIQQGNKYPISGLM